MSHLSEGFLWSLVTTSTSGWHMVACETSICELLNSFNANSWDLFRFCPGAPSLFDPARQWMNQSGEPCLVQHESNPTKKGGSNGRWAGEGQWVNQSGEPSAKHCPMSHLSERFLGSLVTTSTSGWHTVAAQTSSNQMTRKWEFGSGFCFVDLQPDVWKDTNVLNSTHTTV